jgi:hypothetical protein
LTVGARLRGLRRFAVVEIVEEEPKSVVETIEETPFSEDQESLHNPLGLAMNVAMVVVAAAACAAVVYFYLYWR